ncbi:Asp-tRNA(Asn)/Glu-tRNA(Gln) amidotransferase subunit GatB [candidate division WWE3 bacterium]|nr:Asp-tRNA(Asn)/Glu-tRNA(Gln) amidotransferase subunit GatB [candidate division WWE3 bacterium]
MTDLEKLLGEYRLVLGLEIHLHLKTKTKMFCYCDAKIYDSAPNSHTCPVCLGLPGALPIPNFEAVRKTQLLGLALGCSLNEHTRFDRKHYSYPDLPKGYQISQYQQPFCESGFIELSSGQKADIERIHLEEDTAKSMHKVDKTLIDFNKSGMPLVEIVTKPTFKTIDDAVEFSKRIQDAIRILGIADGDMEKGQMRLEANISLRTTEMEREGKIPTYKVEIKNINSFKFMEKAVKAEIIRQRGLLENGSQPIQENRGYDEDKNLTISQRGKEDAHDYRYFPEPDIPPMVFDEDYFEQLREELPELPSKIKTRLVSEYSLSVKNADFLTKGQGLELLNRFEELCSNNLEPEKVANLLINKQEYRELSSQDFIKKMQETNSKSIDSADLDEIIKSVVQENSGVVSQYKLGKISVIEFLVGQVMKKSKGTADALVVRDLLIGRLK